MQHSHLYTPYYVLTGCRCLNIMSACACLILCNHAPVIAMQHNNNYNYDNDMVEHEISKILGNNILVNTTIDSQVCRYMGQSANIRESAYCLCLAYAVYNTPRCQRNDNYGRAVGSVDCVAECCNGPRACLKLEVSGVLGQSFALCVSWQVAHTCRYVQFPGKIQAPLFHDIHMLSDLRLVAGVKVLELRGIGGFKHWSAHCARV